MRKFKIKFSVPSGWGYEKGDVRNWFFRTAINCREDSRIAEVDVTDIFSSRIGQNRNNLAEFALRDDCDFLCMVDPDMQPDEAGHDLSNQRFWDTSFDFCLAHPGSVVAAPAVGDPPRMLVNVFRYNQAGDMERVSREDAAKMRSRPVIEQVAAIGSGLILIDTLIFRRLPQPWFHDVYKDETETELMLTQDTYFTKMATDNGFGVYANWYCCAGHHKGTVLKVPTEADLVNEKPSTPPEDNGHIPRWRLKEPVHG